MESAIPSHMVCPRARPRRVPDDFTPAYPSFVARHPAQVTQVVMAYFGVQRDGASNAGDAALAALRQRAGEPDGPGHTDVARWADPGGHVNRVVAAYWDDPARFDRWFARHGAAWTRTPIDGAGSFTEILRPRVDHYETLFSAPDRPEGIAVLAGAVSGEVMEHAYWGGARDRLPASQVSALEPSGAISSVRDGPLTRVLGHDAMCLIRSGQDWSATQGDERELYLRDVEPVLREGMVFLRDQGRQVGCLSNRYLTVEDDGGRPTDRSYGLSWWTHLAGARTLGRIAPDACRDIRRGDGLPVEARSRRAAEALPRGQRGACRRAVLRVPRLPSRHRAADGRVNAQRSAPNSG